MMSVRFYLAFWVSGLIAGIVLMERWRRHGGRYVPVDAVVTESTVEAPRTGTPQTETVTKPGIVGQVVAGARLDAERVAQRIRPRTHS